MLACGLDRVGGPEVLTVREVPEPIIQPEMLRVDVAIAGVNFQDTYYRSGIYPAPLPLILGDEGMGRVLETAPGVCGFDVGDRVAWTGGQAGYAQRATVPVRMAARLPDDLPDEAGLLLAQGLTAHYLAHDAAHVPRGGAALVHAAAGGVGSLLTRVLHIRGVRVIGMVSSEGKIEAAFRAGADEVIVHGGAGFADTVRAMTGGHGVDVVFDGVGQPTFIEGIRSLRRRGSMVLYGAAGGKLESLNPHVLATAGSITLIRPQLKDYLATRAEFEARVADLFAWMRRGQIEVQIGGRFALSEACLAHRRLESRQTTGKLILLTQ